MTGMKIRLSALNGRGVQLLRLMGKESQGGPLFTAGSLGNQLRGLL